MTYSGNRKAVALFVSALVHTLKQDCPSITIIPLDKSEDFYVTTATTGLSVDIVKRLAQIYSLQLTDIS
jgi:TolB-like protein